MGQVAKINPLSPPAALWSIDNPGTEPIENSCIGLSVVDNRAFKHRKEPLKNI
jgi:hypothetical protein